MQQYTVLVRHFARRFIEGDLVSPQGERSLTLANMLGILGTPGILYSLYQLNKYVYLSLHLNGAPLPHYMAASLNDKYILVTLSMVLVGFVTVIQWDTLFPDIFDYMILTSLPVRGLTVFAAKSSTVVLLLVVLSLVVNLGHTLIYPVVAMGSAGSLTDIPSKVYCHAVSLFAASAFIFLSLVSLQGVLMTLLPPRAFQWISRYAQFLVMLWLVFLLLTIPTGPYLIKNGYARWFPPMWYLGIYETMLGRPQTHFLPLARMGWQWLGVCALLAPLTYVSSYVRHLRQSLESSVQPVQGPGRMRRALTGFANRWIARHPLERATFHFLPQTILRSGRHRLYLSAYAGVGCAIVLEALLAMVFGISRDGVEGASVALLSMPLVLSFFMLSGLRVVFNMPVFLEANWLFQITEDNERRKLLWGVRKAVLVFAVLPLFAALFPWHVSLLGAGKALLHLWYDLVLSWILMEGLLFHFYKVPFTCSYPPGQSQNIVWWGAYWFCFTIYAFSMASLENRLLDRPVRLAVFCGLGTLALLVWTAFWTRRDFTFIYEDRLEPMVRELNLETHCELKRTPVPDS